jgi:hypothetical protein
MSCVVAALPAPGENVTPDVVKPWTTQFLIVRREPLVKTTPDVPETLAPSIAFCELLDEFDYVSTNPAVADFVERLCELYAIFP